VDYVENKRTGRTQRTRHAIRQRINDLTESEAGRSTTTFKLWWQGRHLRCICRRFCWKNIRYKQQQHYAPP